MRSTTERLCQARRAGNEHASLTNNRHFNTPSLKNTVQTVHLKDKKWNKKIASTISQCDYKNNRNGIALSERNKSSFAASPSLHFIRSRYIQFLISILKQSYKTPLILDRAWEGGGADSSASLRRFSAIYIYIYRWEFELVHFFFFGVR